MDTDVTTTQMTIMGVLMVLCAGIPALVFLLRSRKHSQEEQ